MPNAHLQAQCRVMLTSIETFKAGAYKACLQDDGKISKSEEKFVRKLNKNLDNLSYLLKKSP